MRFTCFFVLFFIWRVIQPFKHHHAQTDKTGAQRKTDCPHDTLNKTPMATPNRMPAI